MWGSIFGKSDSNKTQKRVSETSETTRTQTRIKTPKKPDQNHAYNLKIKLKKEYDRLWIGITILVLILIGITSYVLYLVLSNQINWYSTNSSY
tara:strand:- start:1267 stop:1545 length:279 start_codon:yes stop_codon:yes gene_type:complete